MAALRLLAHPLAAISPRGTPPRVLKHCGIMHLRTLFQGGVLKGWSSFFLVQGEFQ